MKILKVSFHNLYSAFNLHSILLSTNILFLFFRDFLIIRHFVACRRFSMTIARLLVISGMVCALFHWWRLQNDRWTTED